MEQHVTDKELLSEEASIRDKIITLFENTKVDSRNYGLFLAKWKPLSERLDTVIAKLVSQGY